MKHEKFTCDIKDCESDLAVKFRKLAVVMETDDNEGRACEPYLATYEFDMCATCYCKMIDERKLVSAYGAMGHNTYYFK